MLRRAHRPARRRAPRRDIHRPTRPASGQLPYHRSNSTRAHRLPGSTVSSRVARARSTTIARTSSHSVSRVPSRARLARARSCPAASVRGVELDQPRVDDPSVSTVHDSRPYPPVTTRPRVPLPRAPHFPSDRAIARTARVASVVESTTMGDSMGAGDAAAGSKIFVGGLDRTVDEGACAPRPRDAMRRPRRYPLSATGTNECARPRGR